MTPCPVLSPHPGTQHRDTSPPVQHGETLCCSACRGIYGLVAWPAVHEIATTPDFLLK